MRKATYRIFILIPVIIAIFLYGLLLKNIIVITLSAASILLLVMISYYFEHIYANIFEFIRQAISGEVSRDIKDKILSLFNEKEYSDVMKIFKHSNETVRNMFSSFISMLEEISTWAKDVNERVRILNEQINSFHKKNKEISAELIKVMSSLKEIKNKIEQLTKLLSETYEKISKRESYSEEVLSNLEDTVSNINKASNDAIKAFYNIKDYWKTLSDVIKDVMGASNEISKLARKISILAINASIESVRASDSGRGFAVVAENIEKLSSDARTYVKKITDYFENLLKKAREVDKEIENGIELINKFKERTSRLSEISSRSIEELTSALSETITDIAKIEEIISDVKTVYDFVQKLSNSIEETQNTLSETMSIFHEFISFLDEELLKVQKIIDKVKSNINTVERVLELGAKKIAEGEHVEGVLEEIYETLSDITTLVYAAIDEKGIFTYPKIEIGAGFDYRSRPWYIEAKNKMKPTLVEPYMDYNIGDYVVTYAYPIIEDGFKGVICADLMLRKLF